MTEVVIGDDHAVFLDALSAVLTGHGCTVTKALTIADTVAAVGTRQPDICLMDRHFAADGDGLAALGDMMTASPQTKVLILSGDGDIDSIMRAMRAGAVGYVHKTRSVTVLKKTMERVLRGEVVVEGPAGPAVRPQLARQRDAMRLAGCLTGRERQCLELLVAGQDTAAMVSSLGVSAATVRTHVQALLTKLGAHSRLEAAAFAVRHGLLDERAGRLGPAGNCPRLPGTAVAGPLPAGPARSATAPRQRVRCRRGRAHTRSHRGRVRPAN